MKLIMEKNVTMDFHINEIKKWSFDPRHSWIKAPPEARQKGYTV